MTKIDDIREAYFGKGESISAVARRFSKDRKTVRKYIEKEDFNVPVSFGAKGKDQPKLDPWKGTIDEWLEQDKKAKRKQRHTARRIYQRLRGSDEAFNCSYRTVASYVAKRKKALFKTSKGFLPLVHQAGEAQVDFGDADFYENGTLWRGKYLNVSFPFSNVGTGKTHLAIALGREACKKGFKVGFYRTANLANRLSEAKKSGRAGENS